MKLIKGFNGRYSISEIGEIFIHRYTRKDGRVFPDKIKKQAENKKGYRKINLTNDKKTQMFYVHRLVAQAFIPNPRNLKTVNHINGNPSDNRVSNIEWCTQSENMIHSFRVLGRKQWNEGKKIKTNTALEDWIKKNGPWNKGKKMEKAKRKLYRNRIRYRETRRKNLLEHGLLDVKKKI